MCACWHFTVAHVAMGESHIDIFHFAAEAALNVHIPTDLKCGHGQLVPLGWQAALWESWLGN